MIKIDGLSKFYKQGLLGRKLSVGIDDISFTLPKGKCLGITGESGCGKSTLLKIIAGLLPLDKGSIYLDNRLYCSDKWLANPNKVVQYIFQNPETSLDPSMKIYEQLEEVVCSSGDCDVDYPIEMITKVLDLVDIDKEILKRYPHQISGGEAQRICIARVLLKDPKILLLDEPTSMLDVSIQASIINILKDIQKKTNMTYIFVSHDLEIIKLFCDYILIMHNGKIVEYGNCETVFANPKGEYTRVLLNHYY